jgi:hypothetical protein
LPCSPTYKADSDWRHEKELQKPNRNALRVSPSKNCLRGRNFTGADVQQGEPKAIRAT